MQIDDGWGSIDGGYYMDGWMNVCMQARQMDEQIMDDGWITDDGKLDAQVLAAQMDGYMPACWLEEQKMDGGWMVGDIWMIDDDVWIDLTGTSENRI